MRKKLSLATLFQTGHRYIVTNNYDLLGTISSRYNVNYRAENWWDIFLLHCITIHTLKHNTSKKMLFTVTVIYRVLSEFYILLTYLLDAMSFHGIFGWVCTSWSVPMPISSYLVTWMTKWNSEIGMIISPRINPSSQVLYTWIVHSDNLFICDLHRWNYNNLWNSQKTITEDVLYARSTYWFVKKQTMVHTSAMLHSLINELKGNFKR